MALLVRPAALRTPSQRLADAQYDNFPGTQQYYFSGNVMPGYFDENSQDKGKKAAKSSE